MLGPSSSVYLIYTSEMFELVENRLYPYADDAHYWQLYANLETDLLLLHPLAGTWLGFRSGAITGG